MAPVTDTPYAHNTHNTQKAAPHSNSADIANFALGRPNEAESRLLQALTDACRDQPITPPELRKALTPEDIEDWCQGDIRSDALSAFARAMVQRRAMNEGVVHGP